jgi:hypothetical protein
MCTCKAASQDVCWQSIKVLLHHILCLSLIWESLDFKISVLCVWTENLHDTEAVVLTMSAQSHFNMQLKIMAHSSKCYRATYSRAQWLQGQFPSKFWTMRNVHHITRTSSELLDSVTYFTVHCVAWIVKKSWDFFKLYCTLFMTMIQKYLDFDTKLEAICLCEVSNLSKSKRGRQYEITFFLCNKRPVT